MLSLGCGLFLFLSSPRGRGGSFLHFVTYFNKYLSFGRQLWKRENLPGLCICNLYIYVKQNRRKLWSWMWVIAKVVASHFWIPPVLGPVGDQDGSLCNVKQPPDSFKLWLVVHGQRTEGHKEGKIELQHWSYSMHWLFLHQGSVQSSVPLKQCNGTSKSS